MRMPSYNEDSEKPGLPRYIALSEARRPNWRYKNQPFLGFVTIEDVFEGPIFGRLRGSRPVFTERITRLPDGSFLFDPDLANSWKRLERALIIIARQFFNPLRPLDTPIPPYPSDTKFYDPKSTFERTINSVLFAQKLFVFLIAELRHNIAVNGRVVYEKITWVKYLETSTIGPNIDKGWLSNLAESKAMRSTRFAGYLVNPSIADPQELIFLRKYHDHGVPIYVIFTKIDRSNVYKPKIIPILTGNFEKSLPLPFSYAEALAYIEQFESHMQSLFLTREHEQLESVHSPHHMPSPASQVLRNPIPLTPIPQPPPHPNDSSEPIQFLNPNPEEGDTFPEPLPHSGQKPGEWWYEYLVSRRQQHSLEQMLEDEGEENERVEQEDYYLKYKPLSELPEEFAAVVYAWRPTPQHPEFLLRTPLEMSEVRAYWSFYPPTHRIYDMHKEVWDLYDPSCNLETLTRSGEIVDVPSPDIEPTMNDVCVDKRLQEDYLKEEMVLPDLAEDRRTTARIAKARLHQSRSALFFSEDPKDYVHHRYGLVLHPQTPIYHNIEIKWWLLIGKHLQEENFPDTKVVGSALHCLSEGHSTHIHQLFDIYLQAKDITNNNRIRVKRIPGAIFRTMEEETKHNLYLLEFPGLNKNDWVFGVCCAAHVVLALREDWAHHSKVLLRNFLKYGIEFMTLKALPKNTEPQNKPLSVRHRVPLAPESNKFSLADYEAYELHRERFFDSPDGRVAARTGGTVARLWRKNQKRFTERVDEVAKGPTDLGIQAGVKVYCGDEGVFFDDYLPGELDSYICGQYLARPGK